MRRFRWIIPFLLILVIATFVAWPHGVKAIIRNNGSTAMRDVRVIVTGRSYSIGDLQPHESRSVHVKPTSESHIVLAYGDPSGTGHSLDVNCYLESGYSGHITVDVADGQMANVDDQIRVAWW